MTKKFVRKDTHKKKRLSIKWRKPKGLHNKRRLQLKGHSKNVKPGYRTKSKESKIVMIYRLEDMKGLNPKIHILSIAKISKKNKLEVIEEAEKTKFTILNLNVKLYKKKTEEFLKSRKEASRKKKERESKKKEAEKEATDKKKEKEKKEEELTDEEKKKKEKEEKDKILTKGK